MGLLVLIGLAVHMMLQECYNSTCDTYDVAMLATWHVQSPKCIILLWCAAAAAAAAAAEATWGHANSASEAVHQEAYCSRTTSR
jgi:hypothetical protein